MAGPLVAGSGGKIRRVIADGAYDGQPVSDAIRAARPARSPPRIVIPPPAKSIPPPGQAHGGSERERHCAEMAMRGRRTWQQEHGYGLKSLAETGIGRLKRLAEAQPPGAMHQSRSSASSGLNNFCTIKSSVTLSF